MDASLMDPDTLLSFAGRLHPLLLHLPIGLWLGIAVLEFGGALVRRAPGRATLSILTWVAAFGGAFAAGSGWLLAREGYDPKTTDVHRWLGVAAAGIGLLAACFSALKTRGAFRLLLSIEFVVLMAAGHLGSEITHGRDWLFEPFEQNEKERDRAHAMTPTTQPAAVPAQGSAAPGSGAPGSAAPGSAATTEPPARTTEPAAQPSTGAAVPAPAEPTTPAKESMTFEGAVEPILKRYCTQCHGEQKQKGDLALHTRAAIEKGGENGPVVVAGRAELSPLFTNLLLPIDHDDHMPPDGKKQPTPDEIGVLRAWIDSGARFAAATEAPPTPAPDRSQEPGATGGTGTKEAPKPAGGTGSGTEPEPAGGTGTTNEPEPSDAPKAQQPPEGPTTPPAEPRNQTPPQPGAGESAVTPALQAARVALERRHVLVRAIADDPDAFAVDFGPIAASTTADEVRTLLQPVAHCVVDLCLARVPVDDRLLTAVAALPRLQRLDLAGTRTTTDLLRPLVRATALRELVLTSTRLDDRAADVLLQVPALASLIAADAGLGPVAAARLAARDGLVLSVDAEAMPRAATPDAKAADPAATKALRPPTPPAPQSSEPQSPNPQSPNPQSPNPLSPNPLSPQNPDCPVCHKPVDGRFVVVHGNRAVAFCSVECPVAFWQDPAKYPLAGR